MTPRHSGIEHNSTRGLGAGQGKIRKMTSSEIPLGEQRKCIWNQNKESVGGAIN